MMKQPDLGKKILELRLAKGLTQTELAKKCNIGLRTIQRIEVAEVEPRSYTVRLIFSCLNYDSCLSVEETNNKLDKPIVRTKIWLGHIYKYVFELFNIKTNTMRKISILSLTTILVSMGLFLNSNKSNAQKIDGWFKAGTKPNSYIIGLDMSTYKSGKNSAFIESTEKKIDGFGTLMQTCNTQKYLGKRIKMTAYIKAQDVSGWAGMWLRVDSKTTNKSVSFDNMQNRPIKGSLDWMKYEITLDVPEESGTLNYGILINGTGKVWFDNLSFEIVDKIKPKAAREYSIPDEPSNVDFEK